MLNRFGRKFGSSPGMLYWMLDTMDTSTHNYKTATYDPAQPLAGHKEYYHPDHKAQYNITELSNGFSVLTESQIFPGAVNMGFLMNVGTRDETDETSGSLLAIKNTYLKTIKHTNETLNYLMIQMSGGSCEMTYDQEKTYYKSTCMEYDVVDMFQMMVDIALEPKSAMSGNVARSKNKKSHDLHGYLGKYDPFKDASNLLLKTAYGSKGLGNSLIGSKNNLEYMDANILQKFVMDNITPRKCLIVANGVKNHFEFVDLVKERVSEILPVPEHEYNNRTPSTYIGGDTRVWSESPSI
jgi:predicted Zn-dependent peptidase